MVMADSLYGFVGVSFCIFTVGILFGQRADGLLLFWLLLIYGVLLRIVIILLLKVLSLFTWLGWRDSAKLVA